MMTKDELRKGLEESSRRLNSVLSWINNYCLFSDCKEKTPSSKACDTEAAKKLWELSAQMVGLGDWNPITADDNAQPN
jgi:hypothetical protein